MDSIYWFNMTREHYFRVQEWAWWRWWCNGVPGFSFCNLLPASRRLFLTSPGSWDWVQRRKWCLWHWLFQWFLLVYSEVLVLRCRVLVEDCCKNDALQNVKSRFIDRWIFFSTPYFSGALSSGGTATGTSEQLEEAGLSEASMLWPAPRLMMWPFYSGTASSPFASVWGVV